MLYKGRSGIDQVHDCLSRSYLEDGKALMQGVSWFSLIQFMVEKPCILAHLGAFTRLIVEKHSGDLPSLFGRYSDGNEARVDLFFSIMLLREPFNIISSTSVPQYILKPFYQRLG